MAGGTLNINKGLYSLISFRCRTTRRVAQHPGETNKISSRFDKRVVVKFAAAI